MKKCISLMFCLFLVLCLFLVFCLRACGDNTKNANIIDVPSEIYSDEDIKTAIDTIIQEFRKEWSGCTLTEISYGGDERSNCENFF